MKYTDSPLLQDARTTIPQNALDSQTIIDLALEEGYLHAGLCSPEIPLIEQRRFEEFLKEGRHAGMVWLKESAALRLNPDAVFPGAESVLVLASYYRDLRSEMLLPKSSAKIARYAHGKDYHKYLRKKGKRLLRRLQEYDQSLQGRIVVDSAPVLEKVYAKKAGIGWQGKHTNLIHPESGSWFFLSLLFLNRTFTAPSPAPLPDLCRDCTLCIEACPTHALEAYKLDAKKCLSYITIEAQGRDAEAFSGKREGWIFGCDICQEVCPYNRNRRTRNLSTNEEAFTLREAVATTLASGQLPEDLEGLRRGSALRRASEEHLQKNAFLANKPVRQHCLLKS